MMAPKAIFKGLETKNSYEVRLPIASKEPGKNGERTQLLNRRADNSGCQSLSIQIGSQLLTSCMLSNMDSLFNAQVIPQIATLHS